MRDEGSFKVGATYAWFYGVLPLPDWSEHAYDRGSSVRLPASLPVETLHLATRQPLGMPPPKTPFHPPRGPGMHSTRLSGQPPLFLSAGGLHSEEATSASAA
jgi:hypothetical protein